MADEPSAHDPGPGELLAQRVGAEVQWVDSADRVVLGTDDQWVGLHFPGADGPGYEDATEAPFLAAGYVEDWERLERYAVRQRFRNGDEIIRRGHFDRSLVIVLSGQLSLQVVDTAGNEIVLDVVGARSVVGEIGFFDPGARSVAVHACDNGELLRLGLSRFNALSASCPLLGRTILLEAGRMAVVRLRRVMALMAGAAGAVGRA